eukprot:4876650-Alexandrium_andersonii.AAC.1
MTRCTSRAAASGPGPGSAPSPPWATLVGYPLAWRGATSGSVAIWVGASFEVCPEGVCVAIPENTRSSGASPTSSSGAPC